jgi:hypothetical protein
MEELGGSAAPPIPDELVHSYAHFHEIADYGRTVIEQYCAWAPKLDFDTLNRPSKQPRAGTPRMATRVSGVNDYHSRHVPKSGAERLELLAGHTIQHLRQLYSILENFGIMPDPRVQDHEWPSHYVLKRLEVE